MTPTDQRRGRGAGILRELAPIAAAAAAAALTVTLVVGPTTARLRTQSGAASGAAIALDMSRDAPSGDVRVQVRPRPAPATSLTDVFDLVSGPETPAAGQPSSFVVSLRPQPTSSVLVGTPRLVPAGPNGIVGNVPQPAASLPLPPEVSIAEAPTKRPAKPLRPVKADPAPAPAADKTQADPKADAKADAKADPKAEPPVDKKADQPKK